MSARILPSSQGESNEAETCLISKDVEFSSYYDYVMVFKLEQDGQGETVQSSSAKTCMNAMLSAGLEIFPYTSCQKDEIFVLIRAPLKKLMEFADVADCLLEVDETVLEAMLRAGDPEAKIAPIVIKDDRRITPYGPHQHIYLEFRRNQNIHLYHKLPGESSPFSKSVRLKLLIDILRAPKREKGCDIEIQRLLYTGEMLALYPLHDRTITTQLTKKCTTVCSMPWNVPAHDLKEYFGEKIALYTVFIGHYSVYLILPSIIGIAFQLVVWISGNFSHPVLPFYSLLITVWSIVMLEYWKRQEAKTAMLWGMSTFEKKEQNRPEFEGKLVTSHINGQQMLYYPLKKLEKLQFFSRTIVSAFIMLVIGVVAAIYVLRFSLQQRTDLNAYSSTIASVLNAVQIQVFNIVYMKICVVLTDNENLRTDTQYEDSMIMKLFSFQFINSYSSFFFLGFVATYLSKPENGPSSHVGQCAATNCMEPLAINLAIIFGTRLFLTNFLDILLPYINYRSKHYTETKGVEDAVLTPAEKEFMLEAYDAILESINAYVDTAIQYGYTILFITALPIASFLSLLNNWARVKFYLYKLLEFYQRPSLNGAQDIGTWMSIFQFLSIAAVVTNGGLICFTMDVLWERFKFSNRVWIFFGFQWVLLTAQYFSTQFIDDVPPEVIIQQQRNEYINEKVIEKVADENYGAVLSEEDQDVIDAMRPKWHCGNILACCCRHRPPLTTSPSTQLNIKNAVPEVSLFAYPTVREPAVGWPGPLVRPRGGTILQGPSEPSTPHLYAEYLNPNLGAAHIDHSGGSGSGSGSGRGAHRQAVAELQASEEEAMA